ncbi:hypothetical protein BD413DRAFT_495446 [Trametes elegans]|nr:hypothetical protein BD413DRAFT_495446 [Trametes elegans]
MCRINLNTDLRTQTLAFIRYFILWLRDYTARYSAWARQSKAHPHPRSSTTPPARAYRTLSTPLPPPNPALALFYLRAKETFLTHHGPYALRLPQDVLTPFHSSSLGAGVGGPAGGSWPHELSSHQPDSPPGPTSGLPPPPDPAVFAEVADRVCAILSESLDRFVVATFHNVGMPRAYCGCAGGTVIGLTGSAPVLLANFLTGGSRWWRFSAIPGLWLGLTIVISAMYGVCMMIYVFGDLRQLRSFEMARFPEVVSDKAKDEPRPKLNIRMFTKLEHQTHLSGRSPAAAQLTTEIPTESPESIPASEKSVVAQSPNDSRISRPSPPKLYIPSPPPPVHTHAPLHTSSRTYPSLARAQSFSSDSTSYSRRPGKRSCRRPCFARTSDQEFDTEDDICTASGSEYESDYTADSDTDASSSGSHDAPPDAVTDEGVSMDADMTRKAAHGRRRARRKRRREPEIYISDAIYDEHPCPEGPATADPQERGGRTSIWGDSSEEDVGTGATFIHPFQWDDEDDGMCTHDIESQAHRAADHQRIDAFDFDGLPPRTVRSIRPDVTSAVASSPLAAPFALSPSAPPPPTPVESDKPTRVHFAAGTEGDRDNTKTRLPTEDEEQTSRFRRFLGFVQQKCGPRNVAMQLIGGQSFPSIASEKLPEPQTPASMGPLSPSTTLNPSSPIWAASSNTVPSSPASSITATASPVQHKATWQTRVRRMLQVPAFASPLTPVLNPVVTRGQWEIVVRSASIALVVSVVVIGVLVAVPETRVEG